MEKNQATPNNNVGVANDMSGVDTSGDNTSVVECSQLWKIFGADNNAPKIIQECNHDVELASQKFQELGCIPAICNVGFKIKKSEIFVIMGLSGSGKSTLVRCLARLIESNHGNVKINGEDILAVGKQRLIELRRNTLGMVFQHFGLFAHMSVVDNVAFGLKMQGQKKSERHKRAKDMIKLVGLEGRENAYPRELSGGQRQRVGIARSLASDPEIWFLDEPFSALDPLIRRQLQDEFLDIQKRLQKSIVFITHDITEALKLADRIAIMRDGEIIQIGTPAEIVLHPVDEYVREFSRDVAKARHATVDSLMAKQQGDPKNIDTQNALRPNMTLEQALATCLNAHEPMPVIENDAGKIIGMVKPKDLVDAVKNEKS